MEAEALKILPAEISQVEGFDLNAIRNQYQELRKQHETIGQILNGLEKSLYPK